MMFLSGHHLTDVYFCKGGSMYKLVYLNNGTEDVKWFSTLEQIAKLDLSKLVKWKIYQYGILLDKEGGIPNAKS